MSALLGMSLVMGSFNTGSTHIAQAVWFMCRSFTVRPRDKHVLFEGHTIIVPNFWRDILLFPIISVAQTLPVPNIMDYVWVPFVVQLVMGYPTSVIYTVLNGTCMCMYIGLRPESVFVMSNILWGYCKGDHTNWVLRAASLAHLAFFWTNRDVSYLSTFVGILAAEGKYRMMLDPHTAVHHITIFSIAGLLQLNGIAFWSICPCLSIYVSNGWHLRWKYTDNVLYNFNWIIVFTIIGIGAVLYFTTTT